MPIIFVIKQNKPDAMPLDSFTTFKKAVGFCLDRESLDIVPPEGYVIDEFYCVRGSRDLLSRTFYMSHE